MPSDLEGLVAAMARASFAHREAYARAAGDTHPISWDMLDEGERAEECDAMRAALAAITASGFAIVNIEQAWAAFDLSFAARRAAIGADIAVSRLTEALRTDAAEAAMLRAAAKETGNG